MTGHVFKPIGANRMYDWEHCAVCNLLSENPIHIMTLPGCETADADRETARQLAEAEELSAAMRQPLADISAKAGKMEQHSPLFYGMGDNPTLFGLLLALLVFGSLAHAQGLPDAPKPDRVEFGLLVADAGIRSLDVYSTNRCLGQGNREMFLPAAIASRPAAMAAVEAADIAAVSWLARRMEKRGHRRAARILTLIDFAQDAPWAIHNLYLPERNKFLAPGKVGK